MAQKYISAFELFMFVAFESLKSKGCVSCLMFLSVFVQIHISHSRGREAEIFTTKGAPIDRAVSDDVFSTDFQLIHTL